MSKKAPTPFQSIRPVEREHTLCALTAMQQQLGAVRSELATLWQELAHLKRATSAATNDPNTHNNHHASDSPNKPHDIPVPLRGE